MKKIFTFVIASTMAFAVNAQHAPKTKTGKFIKKVEHKTAKTGTVIGAKVTDKKIKTRKGPNGETVYIDKYEKKYYVNKLGQRVFL